MSGFNEIKNLIIEGAGVEKSNVDLIEVQKTYLSVIEEMIPVLDFKLMENNEISLKEIINLTGKPIYEQNIYYPLSKIDKDFDKYMFSMKIAVTKYSEDLSLYLYITPIAVGFAIFNELTIHLTNFNWLVDNIRLSAKDKDKCLTKDATKGLVKTSLSEEANIARKFVEFDSETTNKVFELFNLDESFIRELRTTVNLNEEQVKNRINYIKDYLENTQIYSREELMEVIYYE